MSGTFTHQFDSSFFKGSATVNTGLFINGQWTDSVSKETIEYVAFPTAATHSAVTNILTLVFSILVRPLDILVQNPFLYGYWEADGTVITKVAAANAEDVDIAVKAAKQAFKTSWGMKVPGHQRGRLLYKLADLVEKHQDVLAAVEALDAGMSPDVLAFGRRTII